MDYKKLYNPTPSDVRIKVKDTYIVIPANAYCVVSSSVGKMVNEYYSAIEVTDSNLDEYKGYKKQKEKQQKELEKAQEEAKKKAVEVTKTEAKLVEKKIEAQEKEAKENREAEKEAKIAVINNEKEVIRQVKARSEEKPIKVEQPLKKSKKKGKQNEK